VNPLEISEFKGLKNYIGGNMIKEIGKQQLLFLQDELAKAISIANNQRQGETPKFISIASDNNSLIEWFSKEIPGFGYLVPLEIVKLVKGENILRNFMMDINI